MAILLPQPPKDGDFKPGSLPGSFFNPQLAHSLVFGPGRAQSAYSFLLAVVSALFQEGLCILALSLPGCDGNPSSCNFSPGVMCSGLGTSFMPCGACICLGSSDCCLQQLVLKSLRHPLILPVPLLALIPLSAAFQTQRDSWPGGAALSGSLLFFSFWAMTSV